MSELRKGRVSEDFACYSISKVVLYRRPVLAKDASAKILLDSWQFLRSRERIKLFAFCIMPDHFHLVFCLLAGESLSKVMEDTGTFTARELNKLFGKRGQFWHEGFHDHRCRESNDLHELSLYAEHNPVRAGLVAAAELWPYSSVFPANRTMLDREWWP
ncbi:MAG: transposase [Pirellulales bacterium]